MLTALTDWASVEAVLDEAQALGLNVLRTWAFAEGATPNKPALTLQPGVYDETTFRGAVVCAASDEIAHRACSRIVMQTTTAHIV